MLAIPSHLCYTVLSALGHLYSGLSMQTKLIAVASTARLL